MTTVNKIKSAVFSILNVLVVVAIILFILAGLWKIGLMEPPEFILKIFGISPDDGSSHSGSETELFLKDPDSEQDYTIVKADLTDESVKEMLTLLRPEARLVHDLQYSVISESGTLSNRWIIVKENDISAAFYVSKNEGVNKMVLENGGTTSISVLENGKAQTVSYPSGSVSIGEEIGALISHKDFLSLPEDENYTYSLLSSDEGTLLLITFNVANGDYTQSQTYKLNLDYGVVTEANCYENGKAVYSLSTNSLSSGAEIGFDVPEEFISLLPEGFFLASSRSVSQTSGQQQ